MNSNTLPTPGAKARGFPNIRRLLALVSVRMLLGLLLAISIAITLGAAEQQPEDPRDFLLMKLYEAALKAVDARTTALNSPTPGPGSGSASNGVAWVPPDYGCAPWLEVNRATNNASNVVVTLHNTVPALTYKLWTRTELTPTQSWTLETNVAGTSGQDWTAVRVPMNGRLQLFFLGGAGGFGTNKSFAGLQQTNSVAAVPDAMGAVGPSHYMQVLNALSGQVGIAVFDKCSGTLLQSATNQAFFAVHYEGTNYPTGHTTDPRVLFDHEAQRWIATIIDVPTRQLLLAISKTNTPLDLMTNWDRYLLPVARAGSASDFGTLGLDKNGIYISVGQQDETAATVSSNIIVALKKPEIYTGTVISNFLYVSSNDLPASAIFPAVNFDPEPRGGYVWFVAKKWPDRSSTNGGALSYLRMAWSGTNGDWAPVDSNWVEVANSPVYRDYFDLDKSGVTAPQGNEAPEIELQATGSRLMSAIIQNGDLWTCQHVGLSGTNGHYPGPSGSTNVDRSGIQWLRVFTDTNGQFLSITNGRIFDPPNSSPYYYYCPSLAVNRIGDMVTGFSGSRAGTFIGAYYTWRSNTGSLPPAPIQIRAGTANLTINSFGDYSATSLDPLDLSIWSVQSYAGDPFIENDWGTWIFQVIPDAPLP